MLDALLDEFHLNQDSIIDQKHRLNWKKVLKNIRGNEANLEYLRDEVRREIGFESLLIKKGIKRTHRKEGNVIQLFQEGGIIFSKELFKTTQITFENGFSEEYLRNYLQETFFTKKTPVLNNRIVKLKYSDNSPLLFSENIQFEDFELKGFEEGNIVPYRFGTNSSHSTIDFRYNLPKERF